MAAPHPFKAKAVLGTARLGSDPRAVPVHCGGNRNRLPQQPHRPNRSERPMDGDALTTLFNVLGSKGIDFLCLLGIVWVAWRQHKHEEHCQNRHKTHYDAADDLRQRVAKMEGGRERAAQS